MKVETRINRNFFFCFMFVGVSLLQLAMMHSANEQIIIKGVNGALFMLESVILLLPITVPLCSLSGYAKRQDEKIMTEREIAIMMPTYGKTIELACILCKKKIETLAEFMHHIGIEQMSKYLRFCEDNKNMPDLYCGQCYRMVKRNEIWENAYDSMINNIILYSDYRKQYEDRRAQIAKTN